MECGKVGTGIVGRGKKGCGKDQNLIQMRDKFKIKNPGKIPKY